MLANGRLSRLTRVAGVVMLSVSAGTTVLAQTVDSESRLRSVLTPGRTVWITDLGGREQNARVVEISGGVLTTVVDGTTHRLSTRDIARVKARRSDPVLNGALIGAGAAIASGLFLCNLTEPWENCRDDGTAIVRIGAVGAAAGMAIDALIRGRTTIYEASAGTVRLQTMPLIGQKSAGMQLSLRF